VGNLVLVTKTTATNVCVKERRRMKIEIDGKLVEVDLNARAIGWLACMLEDDDLRGLLMARDLKPITFEDYLEEQLKEENVEQSTANGEK